MLTMVIVAVIGWLLFALAGFMYFVGNRINAHENISLAIFGLAILLNDEVRLGAKQVTEDLVRKGRSEGLNSQDIVYRLMQVTTVVAKERNKPENGIILFVTNLVNEIK